MPPWTDLPLLAQDIADVIGIVVFIVIALISWAAQAMGNANKKKQAGQPRRARQLPPRQQQAGRQQAGRQPADGAQAQRAGQGGLQDEIGDFLRQAAQRRQQGGQGGGPAAQPPRRPPGQGRPIAPQPEPRRAPLDPEPRAAEPVAAEVVEPTLVERVAEVARRKAEAEQQSRAAQKKRAAMVGATATAPTSSRAKASGGAVAIRQMFANPLTLRQAVIAAEVFQRPSDRWS